MPDALSASLGRCDPQRGPHLPGRQPGFFHFAMSWIMAEPGRMAGLHVSNYVRRDDDQVIWDQDLGKTSAGRATAYIIRAQGAAPGELGAHVLVTRGLPVTSGAELARLLDAKERKADRSYRCYGGRLPRVGSHVIASLTWGITPEQAAAIARGFAHTVSDRLHIPVEAQVHNKDGRPDHVHLILGTRVVERGKLGRKCRALDAVSERADGKAIQVGERANGATVEWMRADGARRMRDASGDRSVDHRSYARRDLPLKAVSPVPRSEIEYQRRRGSTAWRDQRRRELEQRNRQKVIDAAATAGVEVPSSSRGGAELDTPGSLQRQERARSDALWRATFLGEDLPDAFTLSPLSLDPETIGSPSDPSRGHAAAAMIAATTAGAVLDPETGIGTAAPSATPLPRSPAQPAPATDADQPIAAVRAEIEAELAAADETDTGPKATP